MKSINITPFSQVSPTLAETMRNCLLQAGLYHDGEAVPFILGYPQGWLGTAYHEVLAGLCALSSVETPIKDNLDSLWNRSINKQYSKISRHPLDKRYGPPQKWPGYNLTLSSLRIAADKLYGVLAAGPSATAEKESTSRDDLGYEKQLSAFNGLLIGRPDFYDHNQVIDFKTGGIFERVDSTSVKPAYIRQLRIYAFLVHIARGQWPQKAAIWPMTGPPMEIRIDPDECIREAQEALNILTQYNSLVLNAISPAEISFPSPSKCGRCLLQILCPAFWKEVNVDWLEQLGSHSIEAEVSGAVKPIFGGSSVALSIEIVRGTLKSASYQITPVQLATHESAKYLQQGDIIRIVSLPAKNKATIVPSLRTVIMKCSELPSIRISGREVN